MHLRNTASCIVRIWSLAPFTCIDVWHTGTQTMSLFKSQYKHAKFYFVSFACAIVVVLVFEFFQLFFFSQFYFIYHDVSSKIHTCNPSNYITAAFITARCWRCIIVILSIIWLSSNPMNRMFCIWTKMKKFTTAIWTTTKTTTYWFCLTEFRCTEIPLSAFRIVRRKEKTMRDVCEQNTLRLTLTSAQRQLTKVRVSEWEMTNRWRLRRVCPPNNRWLR